MFFAKHADNGVSFHGSSKPGKRSFGRFSRPLLEVYFCSQNQCSIIAKSLAVAEVNPLLQGISAFIDRFCILEQKYKRGVFEAFLAKKIRFTNRGTSFADWKWTTISEIGEFLGGLSGKTKDDFGHGSDRFITYMNVYKNAFATADGIMPVSIGSDERQNRIQYGDILFTQSSETVEEVGLSSVWLHNSKPYLNSFCMALRPNSLKQLNPKYLGYVMRSKSVRNQIMKEGQGISRINLSGNRILNVGFWCPSLDEQNKIVEVMESLDSICFLSDEKLTRLKDMKSSFIQQLFI